MISVIEATQIVLQTARSFGVETIPFQNSLGRILKENLVADRDFPPFDRVSMDGIAISFEQYCAGQKSFLIEGIQAAGSPELALKDRNNCLEVMTGAILPVNTDTVIRYEDLDIKDGRARVLIEKVQNGQNIHRQGTDRIKDNVIIEQGCRISPAEIGIAATIGKASLVVSCLPKVAVISTGDELVNVEDTPLVHQIRISNSHTLAASLSTWGITSDLLHLTDEIEAIRTTLKYCLEKYDALILSGGVSEGKYDYLPGVFAELGVEKLFHKVAQRPGKPLWFGQTPERVVVFALPGNPVSSFMCLHRYFQPWLSASYGLEPFQQKYASLTVDYVFNPNLTYFLQVSLLWQPDGSILAEPITGGGSGDHANLTNTDAFLELPSNRSEFKKGESFPIFIYR